MGGPPKGAYACSTAARSRARRYAGRGHVGGSRPLALCVANWLDQRARRSEGRARTTDGLDHMCAQVGEALESDRAWLDAFRRGERAALARVFRAYVGDV